MAIVLRGRGVAVSSAAHLLGAAGIATVRETGQRRTVPVIMLSDPALALLRDVFGQPSLFAGKARIEQRIVRWGDTDPVAMPHGAVVVSEDDLAAALDPQGVPHITPAAETADFTLHAMPPFPHANRLRFGERLSATARVTLTPAAAPATCWIESVAGGWLFLIPDGNGGAWLLAVGAAPDALAAQAPMIGPLIAAMEPAGTTFDTSPRMLARLAGEGWLACGTAAIAFDPICGDGTAQAAREGILASAVIGALDRGENPADLAVHYHSLLLAAMRRHLRLSLPFYASGGAGRWWQDQYASARAGYDQCSALLGKLPEPRFALHGFDLVRRELAA